MSSRFFRAISDSESESSSSEEELLSEDESLDGKRAKGHSDDSDDSDESDSDQDSDSDDDDAPSQRKPMSRFMRDADSDSDSEEEVRKVIKSAKDKRLDEFDSVIHTMENAQRIDDWVSISKEFDALLRLCDRQRKLNESIPPSFIKTVSKLDEFLAKSLADKDAVKKMKGPNAKAMNGMKQKVKKTVKENDQALAQYRADPENYDEKVAAAQAAPTVPDIFPVSGRGVKQPAVAESAAPTEPTEEENEEFQTVGKGGKAVMTSDALFKSLAAVMEARGRKSTDRSEQIATLEKLLQAASTPYQKIRVLLALIASRFDYSSSANAYMPLDTWHQARSELMSLMTLLSQNMQYIVLEQTEDYDDEVERRPNENDEGPIVAVRGSIISFVDRFEDEFTKSLQNIDPHTTEYVERLGDEKLQYQTIVRAQSYFESVLDQGLPDNYARPISEPLRRVVMRRLEHIYSKQDVIILALESANSEAQKSLPASHITPSFAEIQKLTDGPSQLVHALCVYLYERPEVSGERQRTRAMLSQVYHHALHADYYLARDRFLMSHLQESIHLADAATQILYNRVLVQLGLSAFRKGLIKECHAALQEIFTTGRVKELLAQGISKGTAYNPVSAEQEKLDRQRQLPFHMHINLELLECVYLVASMLLEVPNMAYAGSDPELRKKIISRPFRRMLDYHDRLVFAGPPENTRDHVMQACKALQNGDWKACIDLINSIKIWKLIPDREQVLARIAKHIQEEGLHTYLFNFATHYDSLSLPLLAETFELTERNVISIVSRMIWKEELAATLDAKNKVIIFQRMELNRIEQLSLALADRANAMLDQNEWLLDSKLGDTRFSTGSNAHASSHSNDPNADRRDARRKGRGRGRAPMQSQPVGQRA